MARGNTFEDKAVLDEMLARYKNGEGAKPLAREYGCDHTSILYQARKHGVWKGKARPVSERTLRLRAVRLLLQLEQDDELPSALHPRMPYKYDYLIEESFSPGISTAEYNAKVRRIARERKQFMEPILVRMRAEKAERDRLIAKGELPRLPRRNQQPD